ncbi:APH-domain-containing protein [Aspergillus saccharolyticus JOP 1030-1]|uniref:APH-domain-containing protein n=1 Tax=Aspergillus saccharolyticus JOP 1030-1 TaxID=1450539 RepID=A0A318ZEX2_9EURO|nr:APH-domain-containing protein [Aspergillus saccharolyticus JOP 1030-1]PYH43183.1 APH-domain-containing protein [Aspergillus saccharolyticus JOP 1030-1]
MDVPTIRLSDPSTAVPSECSGDRCRRFNRQLDSSICSSASGYGSSSEYDRCRACGWWHNHAAYYGTIRLQDAVNDRGVWFIGSDKILKERPADDGLCTQGAISQALALDPAIPAPRVLHDWRDAKKQYFVLEERVPGTTLGQVWPTLIQSEKTDIAKQVAEVRQRLRALTAPSIQSAGGGACYPPFPCYVGCRADGPWHSDAELQETLRARLTEDTPCGLPDKIVDNLLARMPTCGPYVLTHGDLHLTNIMVQEGKLTGIIDWEYAAYYPVWLEYVLVSSQSNCPDDAEWKALLREELDAHGDGYPDAVRFWDDVSALKGYPYLDGLGQRLLEKLSVGE